MAVRDVNLAHVFFISFVFLTDVRKNVTPAEVERLHELLEDFSWCTSDFVRDGIAVLREQYSALWESYESGRIVVDIDALAREIEAFSATASAAQALSFKRDISVFVDKLTHANNASLSRLGLSASNNARAQRRSTINYLLTSIEERYGDRLESRETPAQSLPGPTATQITNVEHTVPTRVDPSGTPSHTMIASGASDSLVPWDGRKIQACCIAVIKETQDTHTYVFGSDTVGLFNYKAGQFVSLEVDVGGRLLRRSYTISSSPSRPRTLSITVKRLDRGWMSNWLFEHMRVGSRVAISGPFGEFHVERALHPKLLLMAAGSGITPIMSMLRWMADVGDDRDIVVIDSVRSPTDIIFASELRVLSSQLAKARIVLVPSVTAGTPWIGPSGRINDAMLRAVVPDVSEREVFICGPQAYMRTATDILARAGVPPTRIYSEHFGAAGAGAREPTTYNVPRTAPSSVAAPSLANTRAALEAKPIAAAAMELVSATADNDTDIALAAMPFTRVVFEQSKVDIACQAGAVLLDIAEANGIALTTGCRSGVCGACRLRKVAGDVRMPPSASLSASDVNEGYVLSCVARVYGHVVVDR